MMTLDQIATLAGVSKTTASYVINGKAQQYRISPKTQQKVMQIVEQYNYSPDHMASSLRVGNSRSFGLIIPDLENSSYARLAKLLERNSRKIGYQILIGCSDDDEQTEIALANTLISRRIDVLLVASSLPQASDFYLKIQQAGTPVIALDRPLDDEHFFCLLSEDLNGAYELTQSVLESRIQTIGLIGALPQLAISRERQLGFELAVKTGPYRSIIGYGQHFEREEGKRIVKQWHQESQIPDAIITTSYTLLEGVLDALLDTPSLMGCFKLATFGDNRLLDFLPMKVNSLSQQFELIADSAITSALNATANRYQAGVELIARKLIIRC